VASRGVRTCLVQADSRAPGAAPGWQDAAAVHLTSLRAMLGSTDLPTLVYAANLAYARRHGYRVWYRVLTPADRWAQERRAVSWGKVPAGGIDSSVEESLRSLLETGKSERSAYFNNLVL